MQTHTPGDRKAGRRGLTAAMSSNFFIRAQPPRATAIAMLETAGLPVADLCEEHLRHFFYAASDGSPAGLVGLELYGSCALLRSLVVQPAERTRGLGTALVRHAEEYAASQGVHSLYLLTLTAESFFERLGYVRAERSVAPQPIAGTSEFASLCPQSSAFMVKTL